MDFINTNEVIDALKEKIKTLNFGVNDLSELVTIEIDYDEFYAELNNSSYFDVTTVLVGRNLRNDLTDEVATHDDNFYRLVAEYICDEYVFSLNIDEYDDDKVKRLVNRYAFVGQYSVHTSDVYTFITKKKAKRIFGSKYAPLTVANNCSVVAKYLGQWINGEIYRYALELNGKSIDSCGGFIGEDYLNSMMDCINIESCFPSIPVVNELVGINDADALAVAGLLELPESVKTIGFTYFGKDIGRNGWIDYRIDLNINGVEYTHRFKSIHEYDTKDAADLVAVVEIAYPYIMDQMVFVNQ